MCHSIELPAKKCLKWHTFRTNATIDERNLVLERDNRCAECNQMYHRARFTSIKRATTEDIGPSSSNPIHP